MQIVRLIDIKWVSVTHVTGREQFLIGVRCESFVANLEAYVGHF